MKLCYGAVFRDTVPLCVFSPEPGNYEKIFIDTCSKGKLAKGKTFLKIDNCLWVISHEESGLNILLVVQNTNDKETVEQFIDEIKSRFIRQHGSEWKTAQAHELYTRFEPQFRTVKQMIESSNSIRQSEVFSPSSLDDDGFYRSPLLQLDTDTSRRAPFRRLKRSQIAIIAVGVLVVFYFVLVLICGGFNLQPNCL